MVPVRRSVKTLAAAATDGKPRYELVYLPVELICTPRIAAENHRPLDGDIVRLGAA